MDHWEAVRPFRQPPWTCDVQHVQALCVFPWLPIVEVLHIGHLSPSPFFKLSYITYTIPVCVSEWEWITPPPVRCGLFQLFADVCVTGSPSSRRRPSAQAGAELLHHQRAGGGGGGGVRGGQVPENGGAWVANPHSG